jgi:hypothetical protein
MSLEAVGLQGIRDPVDLVAAVRILFCSPGC